jgi:uncharacterized protein YlxW (UPF0749 family)
MYHTLKTTQLVHMHLIFNGVFKNLKKERNKRENELYFNKEIKKKKKKKERKEKKRKGFEGKMNNIFARRLFISIHK